MTDWRLTQSPVFPTLALLLCAGAASGQQTGGIEGTVTLRGAASPEGIGILAETGAVPRPRSTVTDASGRYALPRLPPALYRVTFTTAAGASRTVEAQVLLGQTTTLNLELDAAAVAVSEEFVVIGERVAVRGRASVASAIDGEAVRDMPLGPDYRSLVRLAPGVQVTQDSVRGPASGGSGQDNVYRFDGVDVSLPMFGTLSAELSSHDVDQVTFERAGATAVGFNRSGGFTMDSTARSGTMSAHLRRREGGHFWEDTWNGSRGYDSAPAHIAARGLYVPGLDAVRAEIGGSSYVIAQLDDAYTEYSEPALELVWRGERGYLNASYVRSRYTGNFDQDNTSWNNDANLFIGSSNLADGYGRQLWDNKDGTLRGDRPHLAKVFGRLDLPWRASVGAFVFFQSGQPWEAWDSVAYGLPSYFSSTNRYAEQAGSRRGPSHWQLDLGYTQRFRLPGDLGARSRVDLFNLFDRQTGYNNNPFRRDAAFGEPRDRFDPRRVQMSISVEF